MVASRKVVVTGAGGFIGSVLCKQLVQAKADVTALVKYNSLGSIGNLAFLPEETRNKLNIVSGNIEDPYFTMRLCEGADYIFHLAALIGIPYSYIAPVSYVKTNIEGTVNVLEAARFHGVKRVIHTSTSEVYGSAEYEPIDERHPQKGQSPYSASKIAADKMAESYFRSFDVPVVTIRPFNTYGPGQSARAVIPTIIAQALKNDTIQLGSTGPQRDMTYVDDTAAGMIAAANAKNIEGRTINLGTGTTQSIGDIADMIFKIMDKKVKIKQDKKRIRPEKSEVVKLVSDNSRAQDLLGWKPHISLESGLKKTIEHIRAHQDVYNTDLYNV